MKQFLLIALAFTTLLTTSAFTPASVASEYDRWVKLGSRKVNYGLDKDVIFVGARDARFSKLKIEVTGGSLNMHKMVVEYMNGSKDNIPLRHNFTRNGSRVIDLQGGKRFIKDITFWYDTKNIAIKKAKVHVYGRR